MTPNPGGLGVVDPTNPQSWNGYAYVMNNPINLIDLVGLDVCYIIDYDELPCLNDSSGGWGGGGGGSGSGSNLALLGGFADPFGGMNIGFADDDAPPCYNCSVFLTAIAVRSFLVEMTRDYVRRFLIPLDTERRRTKSCNVLTLICKLHLLLNT